MTAHHPEQSDSILRIDCGVRVPPVRIDAIAKMYRAAAAGRDAIRSVRLGETEPAMIFAPVRERTDDDAER